MKKLFFFNLLIAGFCSILYAKSDIVDLGTKTVSGKTVKFYFDKGVMFSEMAGYKSKGIPHAIYKDISQWSFPVVGKTRGGMTAVVNHSRRKIIYFNGSLTSKGPYLHSFSPNQSQLVIYSGVLNGKGEFEIFDKEGRSLFKDNYLGEIKWNPLNQLEYSSATKIVIEKDHPMYEKCLQVGAAYRLDYFRVLGRTKLKGDKPSQIACAKR